MRWGIDDPDPAALEDVQKNVIQAVQQANAYVWGYEPLWFTAANGKEVLEAGSDCIPAPDGKLFKIWLEGGTDYLEFVPEPDFLPPAVGTPDKYWLEFDGRQQLIRFYPAAAANQFVRYSYISVYKARNKDGQLIANLSANDDVLNVPEYLEDAYLAALKPMAMVYLIADSTDENYQPYRDQFLQQYEILRGMTGREIKTRFEL